MFKLSRDSMQLGFKHKILTNLTASQTACETGC